MDSDQRPALHTSMTTRRTIIKSACAAALLPVIGGVAPGHAATSTATSLIDSSGTVPPYSNIKSTKIKALTFDMQGTLLDFYSTILDEGNQFTRSRGIDADWTRISDDWRKEYRKRLDQVIARTISWRSTDVIYREALDDVLVHFDWGKSLSATERDELSSAWSRLRPWADTPKGLERLRRKYKLSTLSNGSMASVINIVKRFDLQFDCVLTAELVKSAKPDPKVYALAQSALGLRPEEILMVACHKYDLVAAHKFGFNVAFIPRPFEFGPNGKVDTGREDYFDMMAPDLTAIADLLDA